MKYLQTLRNLIIITRSTTYWIATKYVVTKLNSTYKHNKSDFLLLKKFADNSYNYFSEDIIPILRQYTQFLIKKIN